MHDVAGRGSGNPYRVGGVGNPYRAVTYGLLDGLFQQALLRHCGGDGAAADYLIEAIDEVLARFMPMARL